MPLIPSMILALCEALATASATTQPRMASKNSRYLGPIAVEIERAAKVGGGTVYGANFLGRSNVNRNDFVGDGTATNYDTNIAYAALSNFNWLIRVDFSTRTGTVTTTVGSATVTGSSTVFTTEFTVGDECVVNGERHAIIAIASDTSMTVDAVFATANAGVSILLADAILMPTADFTVANSGGNARITLAAAGKLAAGQKMSVHFVTPVALFTFATATTQFAMREVQGYDVLWYAAGSTTSPSATNIYVRPIGS